jgi:hypothetical protein
MNINANLSNFNTDWPAKKCRCSFMIENGERTTKESFSICLIIQQILKIHDDADVAYNIQKRIENYYKDNIKFLKDDNITLDDFASFAEGNLVHLIYPR